MGVAWTQEEFEQKFKEQSNDTIQVIGQQINKRTKVLVKCKTCEYEWEFSPTNLMPSNTYNFRGCPKCQYEKTHQKIKCGFCGKEIEKTNSQIEKTKSGVNFCSRLCANRQLNSLTKTNNSSAYRRNAFEFYPHKCAICGWDKDERVLEVHHIDENRDHNELDNLIILCPICHKFLTLHLYTLEELKEKMI